MFKRIDHIELLTAAPERTLAFYRDVLGFRERERMRIPDTPSGPLDLVYLELGGTTIEVMSYPEAKEPLKPRPAGTARFAFSSRGASSRRGDL